MSSGTEEENDDYFFSYFGVRDKTNMENTIMLTYFSFTSLSTVGFGDLHPRSNAERIFCAFILLFGVAIFSYMMGIFIGILDIYKVLDDDLDDGDNLSKFFGLMKKYNGNHDINLDLKHKIEKFFDYKWAYDRNQSIDDEEEIKIL